MWLKTLHLYRLHDAPALSLDDLAEALGKQAFRPLAGSVCPPLARAIVEANFTHERKFMPAPATAVA